MTTQGSQAEAHKNGSGKSGLFRKCIAISGMMAMHSAYEIQSYGLGC